MRFACPDCGHRHGSALGCRCGTPYPQIQMCVVHAMRCVAGCRACRALVRSQSGR